MRLALARLALALMAVVLALSGAELLYRLSGRARLGPTTNPRYIVRDDLLGWRYQPGARARHTSADFDVAISINAGGFRDSTTAAPQDRPILAVGDSLTFGWGVEERESYPSVLEQRTGVPVANLGVSGYGTDQEVLLLERTGLAASSRAVVLTVCENDVEEVSRARMYGRAKPWFSPGPPRAETLVRPAKEGLLAGHSHLLRALSKRLDLARQAPLGPQDVAAGRARVAELILRMRDRVRGAGSVLLVCAYECPWLAGLLGPSDVPFLDLTAVLDEAAHGGAVVFAGDPHWSPRGHRAVAEAVASRLDAIGGLK